MTAGKGRARVFDDFVAQVQDYAIIALDPHGVIETWNKGAEQLKGYTEAEAVGRSFAMFYGAEDRRDGLPMELLTLAARLGRVEHTGWRVRKDGTRFWGDVVITALHDSEGRLTGYAKVTRDLTERHELEESLRASEERLRLLVGQVQDYAIIALDPQGVIETWNTGAERLKGYTEEEALGRSFAMFYTPEDRDAGLPMHLLSEARHLGRVEHTGWRVRKDGTRFWGDVVLTALHGADGRLTGYAKVTRDRTRLKRLEQAQDAFYAAFTHDFKTPLTAMRGFVEAIRDAEDDDEREMLVDRAERSADRLLELVERLVQFARQRGAEAELELGPVEVGALAQQAVHDLSPDLHPERVSVQGGAVALADLLALHRVVTNLVVNALKYSPPDSPVAVGVDTAADGSGTVVLTVRDRGRGIDPADLDSIFDEFQRGRMAREDGGTGLGLASVRELVDQQGGTISVESTVGRGTTMRVTLPPVPRGPAWPQPRLDVTGMPGQPSGRGSGHDAGRARQRGTEPTEAEATEEGDPGPQTSLSGSSGQVVASSASGRVPGRPTGQSAG